MIRKEQLYEQILEQIDLTKETDDEELQELIRTVLDEAADEEYIPLSDKIRIGRELFNSFRKLDVLQELLEDDSITEIMVNGIDHIFYPVYEVFFVSGEITGCNSTDCRRIEPLCK